MRSHRLFVVASTAAVLLAAAGPAKAQVAEILAPKDGASVARYEDFKGRMLTKDGWPVVLIRPLIYEEPWYAQAEVNEVTRDGLFTSQLRIGNATTPPSTEFRVTILVASSRDEAHARFARGTVIQTLPADRPTPDPITVVRDGKARRPARAEKEPRSIKFAGRSWEVKSGDNLGPGPNDFSDAEDNVWVDDEGHLHLAITDDGCAEVVGPSLGYGEYRWVISGELAKLDPQVVSGLFCYRAPSGRERVGAELDFELSRFGKPKEDNCQFVVQPYGSDSMHRFDSGKAEVLTCSFLWQQGLVRGRCWAGEDTSRKPLADWKYTGHKIPRPGGERVRANLWLFHGKPATTKQRQEVVVRSFHFEPVPPPVEPPSVVAKILLPKEGDQVSRLDGVRGQLFNKAAWPVILVRPLVSEDPSWYVQPEVTQVAASGMFTGRAHFGRDDTPSGTEFRIAILVAPSREEAYAKFKRGATLRNLPPELPTSQTVTVSRR